MWVKAYNGANMFLYITFIQLRKTLQHIIQGHALFLYLFVKKKKNKPHPKQTNKQTNKKKIIKQKKTYQKKKKKTTNPKPPKQSREAIKY